MRWSLYGTLGLAVALGACSFDGGGVADDDVDGSTGADADGDGVRDPADNCVEISNADQRDEDGDDVGNVCDNCPHVANADQADDGDSAGDAGDACDPQPDQPGNELLYFEGFDDPDSLDDWRAFNGGMWSISGGALRQADVTGIHTLYLGTTQFDAIELQTHFVVDSRGPDAGAGALTAFSTGPGEGAGYLCLAYDPAASTGTLNLLTLRGSQVYLDEASGQIGANLVPGDELSMRASLDPDAGTLGCTVDGDELPSPVTIAGDNNLFDRGFVALKTSAMAAHVDYVAVFAINP